MDDLSMITVNADSPMGAILERLSHDAASAADTLEATAADIDDAIMAVSRQECSVGDLIARLRRRRSELTATAAEMREQLRQTDDAVTARMAAAMIREFDIANQVSGFDAPPVFQRSPRAPSLQVVK